MVRKGVIFRVPGLAALFLVGSILSPKPAGGTTWHVPGDAPTIQAGINLAQSGDDVLVAPGVYPEHDIVMKGGVLLHSEQGPGVTTVDAQDAGRVFLCSDFQDEATIEGFTLVNGRTAYDDGGGVWCIRSVLRIQDCVITGCFAGVEGGGVYAEDASVQIVNCELTDNRGETNGGGIKCTRGSLILRACVVADCYTFGCGGGVEGRTSSMQLVDCEILRNRAWCGGGVAAYGANPLTIERCVISSNRGLCEAGGIGCSGAFDIANSLIVDNSSMECGIGWALLLSGAGRIAGCTVAANRGYGDREVILVDGADLSVERTIVAFHDGGDAFVCLDSDVSFRCCDVYGNRNNDICGEDLGGNFSADPLFCDAPNGDYTLDARSPCLPGNHPNGVDCGLIGALGQGCGATPIHETSWGRLKVLYGGR